MPAFKTPPPLPLCLCLSLEWRKFVLSSSAAAMSPPRINGSAAGGNLCRTCSSAAGNASKCDDTGCRRVCREEEVDLPRPLLSPSLSLLLSPSKDWEKKLRRCAEAAAKGFAIGAGLKGGLAVFSIIVRLRSRRSSASKARKAGTVSNWEAIVFSLKETLRSAYILKQESLPSTYKSFLNKHGGKDPIILQGVKEIACGIPFTDLEGIMNYYKSTGVDIQLDQQMKVPCSSMKLNGSHCIA
ncbi:hypothetical protein QJS04_geneDACA019667 [Acorus gramineus]|uniref:Uncharacterized protein n=1 Tax=Acorus gramineus TaxID=55184 RepID=A0AAV9BR57_ACOGR|nr:hypothetical protein QJS04_geneDACA019667 [Acorus gramineus]